MEEEEVVMEEVVEEEPDNTEDKVLGEEVADMETVTVYGIACTVVARVLSSKSEV
jgi:hypothetical protein